MRKQSKIISLILVLALLLSMLVLPGVTAAADTSAADSGTEAQSETFTPTAEFAEGTTVKVAQVKSSVSGNLLAGVGTANWNAEALSSDTVTFTDDDGNEAVYGRVTALAEKSTGNHFINIDNNDATLTTATETDGTTTYAVTGYYVIDIDIATESDIISYFTINPILRTTSNAFCDAKTGYVSSYVPADGDWHHVTIVGDLVNNVLYVFVDGEMAENSKVAYVSSAFKGTEPMDIENVRIDIGGGLAMNEGGSFSFDNIAVRTFASNDEIATALAAGTLGGYANVITEPEHESLPAIATVDGVEYSNVNALSKSLVCLPADIELLRDYAGIIKIGADATVETNGLDFVQGTNFTVAEGATVTSSGTVVTVDAPFLGSVESETITNNVFDSTKADASENVLDSFAAGSFSADTAQIYLVKVRGSDNTYMDVRAGTSHDSTSTTHTHLNYYDSAVTYYTSGSYMVMDYDVFADSAVINAWVGILSKTSSVNSYANSYYLRNIGLTPGRWNHVTVIHSVDENVARIYIDGMYTTKISNGAICQASDVTTTYLAGVRINIRSKSSDDTLDGTTNLAIDNVAIRMNLTDDEVAACYASDRIVNWRGMTEGPALPVLATVDGAPYYSTAALSDALALISHEPREVVFYRSAIGTVAVGSDAVLYTNGYTVNYSYDEGATVTVDGDVVTVDAPYKASSSSVNAGLEVSGFDSLILGTVGRTDLDNSLTLKMPSRAGFYSDGRDGYSGSYIVTNNYTGDVYWHYDDASVTSSSNSYADFGPTKEITYDASVSQYFVYDFDFAALSESAEFNLQSVTRVAAGSSAGSIWGNKQNGKDIANLGEIGYFQHVTIVLDVNNNDSHLFVNGKLVKSVTSGGFVGETVHTDFVNGSVTKLNHNGIRFGSNSLMDVAIANMSLRYFSGATDYSTALAGGDLGDFNIYSDSYDLPEIAPIAILDGERIPAASALAAAFDGVAYGDEAEVYLTADFTDAATVSGSATVNTNGHTHALAAQDGVVLTDLGNGTLSYYETALALELQTSGTNVLAATKYSASDNLFSYISWQIYTESATAKYKGYLATDNATGNQYGYFGDGVNGSGYVGFQNDTQFMYDESVNPYVIYDFDAAVEDGTSVALAVPIRDNDSTNGSPDHNGCPYTLNAVLSGYNYGDFQHITMVIDVNSNQAYVFVNGEYYTTYTAYHTTSANSNYPDADPIGTLYKNGSSYIQVDGIRFGTDTLGEFSVDNFYARSITVSATDTSSNSITAALAAKDITVWSGAITSAANHVAPFGEVDGQYYYTVADLESALAENDGTEHESELTRVISDTVKVGSLGTVTNKVGADLSPAYGYRLTDNGNGTYTFTVETREGTITINITDSAAYELSILYGTDIREYLVDEGIIEGELFFDAGGNIYTGWTDAFGTVEGDATYDLGATLCEKLFVVLVNGAVKDSYDNSEAGFLAALKASEACEIILNKDMTLTIGSTSGNVNGDYDHTIRLNGHTLTTDVVDSYDKNTTDSEGNTVTTKVTPEANLNHLLYLASGSGALTFVGPGTIYDCSRENTTQFVFSAYNYNGTVSFEDLSIIGTGSLAVLRGGNLSFENVDIDWISAQDATFIQLGEEYNGNYSKYNASLTFKSCNVNARHHRANNGHFLVIKDIPSNPDIAYTVNIIDSVINIGYGSEYALRSYNANTVINAIGSEIRAHNLFAHGYTSGSTAVTFSGTFNVCEGTKFASSANTAFDFVKIGDGLVLVNSGDLNAPYLYTSEYATVEWPDGTVEYWADGTYPTNASYPLASVERVEAGKSYSFDTIDSLGFAIKANLTLTSGIQFNLYVPKSAAITAVNIGGVEYGIDGASIVAIEGVEHYVFAYDILPSEAAGVFTFAISTADWTVAREMSVLDYASLVYATSPAATTLMSNILKYVYESHAYFAIYSENLDAISETLATYASSVIAPSAKESDTDAISGVIESASLNLQSTLKLRFNIVDGADISDLVFTVSGSTVEYTVGDGYVEIELRAYDLLKDITISVGDNTGTYNLYAYYSNIVTTASGCTGTGGTGTNNEAARAYKVQALIKALCSYAAAAESYHG